MKKIILWAGAIPEDVLDSKHIRNNKFEIIVGDEDEFISKIAIDTLKEKLNKNKISYDFILFEGKHIIDAKILEELFL